MTKSNLTPQFDLWPPLLRGMCINHYKWNYHKQLGTMKVTTKGNYGLDLLASSRQIRVWTHKIAAAHWQLLISCFTINVCTIKKTQRLKPNPQHVCFFFFSCVQRDCRFAAVATWKGQIMSRFEVWPQCGESQFESRLLWIKLDFASPPNLVSKIPHSSEHCWNAGDLEVLLSHQNVTRNCL